MPSSPTSPSPFRSSTSLAAVALAGLLAACNGDEDTCGPGDAPSDGITITGPNVALTYDEFDFGQNNDCPEAGAPSGVISVTIHASQVGGALPLTFCFGRPDLLAEGPLDLGQDDPGVEFRVVDASGMDASCTYEIDTTAPITGTASTEGLCNNGAGPDGFALILDGDLTLKRTCGATMDTVAVSIAGRVAVVPQ
jgi:hypothetical protein